MQINSFQDILAWQKSHQLVLMVYKISEKYPKHEIFGLTSQSRRCGVSIPSNIAEGFRRNGLKDSLHFYNAAQASLEELRYQMILARDLKYLGQVEYEKFVVIAEEASKVLNGWIKSQVKRS
jgi:four helix bundle protein